MASESKLIFSSILQWQRLLKVLKIEAECSPDGENGIKAKLRGTNGKVITFGYGYTNELALKASVMRMRMYSDIPTTYYSYKTKWE